jgi:translation initiation factor IF-3
VTKDTKDIGVIEQMPRMEGRAMFMILAPNPKVAQRAREAARLAALGQTAKKPHQGGPPNAGGHKGPAKDGASEAAAPDAPAASPAPAPAPSAQPEPARQG